MRITKKSKMSNNIKKMLAITMVIDSTLRVATKDNVPIEFDGVEDIRAVVANTIKHASKLHTKEEFNYVRAIVIKTLTDNKNNLIDNNKVFGLLLNSIGNHKLLGFFGLHDADIIDSLQEDITVNDVNNIVRFLGMLDKEFNTKPYYSILPIPTKAKKTKKKHKRDKKVKIIGVKKNKKVKLLTEDRARKLTSKVGLYYQLSDDGLYHRIGRVKDDLYYIPIEVRDDDTVTTFKKLLIECKDEFDSCDKDYKDE
jgi:hypothetical protein